MAQPMTQRAGPMNGAQTTLVRMQAKMPMMEPFQKAEMESSFATGMEKATVAEKKMRTIHVVTRLVCFTQTWWAWCGGSRHAKLMPAMKQPQRCVPRRCVIKEKATTNTICRRNSSSSCSKRMRRQPVRPAVSLLSGACGMMILLMTVGQNFTARPMAKSMNAMPMIGARTTLKRSNSPPKLKSTLNNTRDRMSSTNAAVMMACPNCCWSTPASPSNRSAMPTLVGARAVPAETP
mmetsp:Transcript_29418/g.68373  ORF Transcript_29418/g.68373 Transcript_29418/m.68373 type:complete len:235 (-) Transcript_29418:933-1637(-)